MEVSEEHDGGKEKRETKECNADGFLVPKEECDKEREAGVAREEKIGSRTEPSKKIIRVKGGHVGRWSDVGECDEYRADNDEERDTFDKECEAAGMGDADRGDKTDHDNASIHERAIEVEDGNTAQE